MLSDDSIVAIVTAVIGSGGLGGLTGWFSQHLARRRTAITREDLKPIEGKLDRDFEHFHALDEQMRDIKLIVLRQCLFARPRDQNAFTSALESGEEYLRMGGNGVGHIRLDQLKREYEIRDRLDDWNPKHEVMPE
ncbi:MAG: hypothetical protein ABF747_02235 [Bifidobacterium sp.]|uniref:Phage protein n=1 Tax=Bifidobacterium fermentum TaxID=3059035 RepID=A0AB39UGL4_9BIFI